MHVKAMKWLLIVALVFVTSACESQQSKRSASQAEPLSSLRVGISRTFPPLIYTDGDKTVGMEADFALALGETLGRDVRFVPMYFPNLIYELEDHRIDIVMSGLSVTPERLQRVAFTKPYLVIGQQALIRQPDRDEFSDKDAVQKTSRRVGVENDSTGHQFARMNLRNAQVMPFGSVDLAVQALLARTVDVVISDSPSVSWQAQQAEAGLLSLVPGTFTQETLAWAISQDNEKLLHEVNDIIADWQTSGRMDEIINRWLIK